MKTTTTQATDTQLVDAFKNGNGQALEVLINRHKDKIFSSILFLVKDKYLAEDLFQDVFIKVIDTIRADRYNEEGKFCQWALRIAHNLCIDHFRKLKRNPIIRTNDDQDIFDVLNLCSESGETLMMNSQSQHGVRKLIDKLPKEQREVLVLRHFADFSFKEIAEMTGCSVNTALGRMRYGLINMRKMIEANHVAV